MTEAPNPAEIRFKHFAALHPWYRVLLGPVSISNLYRPVSRGLMVSFLKTRHLHADLASSVRPRHRFRTRKLRYGAQTLEDLSEALADLEQDHKGVPVLLRQYLNVGGQILEFSVDGQFSNVLDGLLVVDLAKTNPRVLDRYLGKSGADRFRRYHNLGIAAAHDSAQSSNFLRALPSEN